MSKYAEKNLTKDESIVLQARISFWALVPWILWCAALLAGVIYANIMLSGLMNSEEVSEKLSMVLYVIWALFGLLPLIVVSVSLCCTCLCITNKRVIGKVGVLRIHTLDYPINKVDNVTIKAGILGNLFKYHTVRVLGGGNDDTRIRFKAIGNAAKFKNSVTEAVERHAEEARRAQAEEIARAMANR